MDIREEIYDEITKFPLPDHIVTYRPYIPNRNEYRRSRRTTFDDLIYLNLKELVPNVYLGMHKNHDNEEIKRWIQLTKMYGNKLNEQLQYYCNEKLNQVQQIEENTKRTAKFNYKKVKELNLIQALIMNKMKRKMMMTWTLMMLQMQTMLRSRRKRRKRRLTSSRSYPTLHFWPLVK